MTRTNSNWLPFIVALAVALGVIIGYFIQGRYNDGTTHTISIGKPGKLEEIMGYIDQKYVEEVDKAMISEVAIDEILEALDPHSIYISADEMSDMLENMSGNFEGIGIEFFIVNDTIMVVTPLSGGPSEALGIQSGDKIVMIDDSLVAGTGITNSGVVKRLKGPKGTEVKVGIQRNGMDELLDFNIKRDRIPLVSVDVGYQVSPNTGYIKVNRFSANTYREFMDELTALDDAGVNNLILDLRQNPGGYLEEATKMLDEFIDGRKELVYTKGRQHPKFTYNARRPGIFEDGEVIVLIDEGSASASEIIAGSLQDWDRGTIIGRRSFGKGLVQEQYGLQDGSALRLTVAKYYTPSGRCIQKPYDDEGVEYRDDIEARYEHGELFSADSISFSDSLVFYTKIEGREVYGGGGITPDYFVPIDTLGYDDEFSIIVRNGFIQQFCYDYFSDNQDYFQSYASDVDSYVKSFEVPEEIMSEFIRFADDNTERDLKLEDIEVRNNLENRIKAAFGKQLFNGDAFYVVLLENDMTYQYALEYLNQQLAVE